MLLTHFLAPMLNSAFSSPHSLQLIIHPHFLIQFLLHLVLKIGAAIITVIRLHPMPQLIKNTSVGYKHSLDAFISVLTIKFCLSTSRLTQRYFKP